MRGPGRFAPHIFGFPIFLVAKRRRLTTQANVVGGVKKLMLSFLTPPYRKVQSPSPLFSLFYSPRKQDVVILWHPRRLHKEQRPSRRQHLESVASRCHCFARRPDTAHRAPSMNGCGTACRWNTRIEIRITPSGARNPPHCRTSLTFVGRQLVTGGFNIFPVELPEFDRQFNWWR